jgi:3-deoxy-manno-octulosonate cytidylyltransferase (CMP-KDO synthetase)
MRKVCALIPCRYTSTRLPGKALLSIYGKSIIHRTYEQVCKSSYIDKVYIVCDGNEIYDHVNTFSKDACIIISDDCLNGTDRICHALNMLDSNYDIIVNIQGDEPYINPVNIDYMIQKYIDNIKDNEMVCTTIHAIIKNDDDIYNRNIGKMILNGMDDIIYASRGMIPHTKTGERCIGYEYKAHIGAYVFRREFLEKYLSLENTPLQLAEDIEWLKIIEYGYKIKSYSVNFAEIGVNTQDDYDFLKKKYRYNKSD